MTRKAQPSIVAATIVIVLYVIGVVFGLAFWGLVAYALLKLTGLVG